MLGESLMRSTCLSILLLLFYITDANAQYSMRAIRLTEPINLDGSLTDPGWALAPAVSADLEVDPAENVPARQKTEIRMAYTDEYLYVSFICYDTDMSQLRANIADRDNMFEDDFVLLFLDTYGDRQKAYEFLVNPRNIQGDGLISQGAGSHVEDISYEMVWRSAAAINDSSWVVEMGIPFSSIRFPDKEVQTWNVYIGRTYPRETRATFSTLPWDRNNPCLLCQTVKVEGVRGIESGVALDVLPYVIGTQRGSLVDQEDPTTAFQQEKLIGRAGVGLKIAPTPDMTIEGVLNPDFSQIESDAPQISVNTTFALFYPERRPFFLEGADLFRPSLQGFDGPSLQVFYTRTVNDPIVAGKAIGKLGSFSYGFVSASDRNTNLLVPGEEGSDFAETGRNSLVNVARVRYDLGDASFIGGLASTRHLSGSGSNIVVGSDWGYRFWENYSFGGIVYVSRTEEPNDTSLFSGQRMYGSTGKSTTYDGEVLNGVAAKLYVGKSARDEYYSLSYDDISPLFQAQNGFIARTNKRVLALNYGRVYYPEEGSALVRFDIGATTGFQLNYDGIRKERFFVLNAQASFRGQINTWLRGLLLNQERFRGVYFRNLPRLAAGVYANPVSFLALDFSVEAGNFVYRETPPELGYGHNISLNADVKFTDRFRTGVGYSRARLASDATGALYYDGNIYRVTSIYQFTPEMLIRLIGQYDSFQKNFNVYPLFSFKLNPFTVFYAGATRNAVNFGNPAGFTTTETNYFLKLQYLIQG